MTRGLKVKFKGRTMQEFARRYLTDISASGMFVRTQEPLQVGTRVSFEFRLEDDSLLLEGEAVVLWKAEESPELNLPAGMELRFDSFGPGSQDRFHWLQLERRGVTVGREVPLSISSTEVKTKALHAAPANTAQQDATRKRDTIPGRPDPEMPQPRQQQPAQELELLEAQATVPFYQAPAPPEAVPTVELPLAPASRAMIRAPQQGLVARQREAEALPEDSDPGRLFHEVAKSDSFLAEEEGELSPLERHATVLVDWEEQERKRTWKAQAAVGIVVTVVGLTVVYLATSSKPKGGAEIPPPLPSIERVVELSSTPEKAQVLLEGEAVGQTPLALPVGKSPRLEIRHAGFLPRMVAISDGDPAWTQRGRKLVLTLQVELTPVKQAPREQAPTQEKDKAAAAPDSAEQRRILSRSERRQLKKAQEGAKGRAAQGGAVVLPAAHTEVSPPADAAGAGAQIETAAAKEPTQPQPQPPGEDKLIKVPVWAKKSAGSDAPVPPPAPVSGKEGRPPASAPEKKPPEKKPEQDGPLKKPSWIDG